MTKNREIYSRERFKSFNDEKTHEILSNMLVHLRELNRLNGELRQTDSNINTEYADIDFVKLKNRIQLQRDLLLKRNMI